MGRPWLIAAGLAGLAGCAAPGTSIRADRESGTPDPPHRASAFSQSSRRPGTEALAGRRAADRLEAQLGGVESSPFDEQRMRRIAARLGAQRDTRTHNVDCRVLASVELNAYSLPGPRMYVTRGLLDRLRDDDALAAMIAHELAHLLAGDSYKPPAADPHESLERELRADRDAIRLLAAAGFDCRAYEALLAVIADSGDAQAAAVRSRAVVNAAR